MSSKRIIPAAVVAALALPAMALAAGGESHVEDVKFGFEGPFGTYDKFQLQRGFQVYHEVCKSCHGMQFVSFRSLGEAGGPEFPSEQVKAIAAMYELPATPGEPYIDTSGERQEEAYLGDLRQAAATDDFPEVTTANAPDLSLMAKARAGFHGPAGTGIAQLFRGIGGAEYIHALLTGYADPPECAPEDFDGHYNTAFASGGYPTECKIFDDEGVEIDRKAPGSWISMAPPIADGWLEYTMHGGEGDTLPEPPEATLEQMSLDVSSFLMWAAEPKLIERKEAGFRNLVMILILAILLFYTNRKLWAPVKREEH